MAAHFHPPTILCLFILLFISDIPQFFSQSTSPQNIQTYYPFSPPPPTPVNDQPNIPPPTTSIPPPQPQRRSSTRSAVGKAIGVTAASTLVLSGLLFFFLLRYSRRKRENGSTAAAAAHGGTNAVAPQNGDFMRFNGNVKGVIVDEDGLDVLYWRKLQEGENRSSFKKQYYKNLSDEQEEEEKRTVSDRERRYRTPVQEAPLLRGKSSTSQSPIWGDNEEQIFKKTPSVSTQMAVRVEGKQYSSVQLVKNATLPPPPGASPQSLSSLPLVPPQIPLAVGAVPKGKVAAPPPPPPIPSNKGPAPPPPPPPSSGSAASSLKPPPVPKGEPSKRSSSLGEDTSSNGNGQVKLKPLHWDKVNPNVEHSMVWDKIDKGSFKFDGDLMEALFGYVATNRKSPQRDGRSASPSGDKSGPPSQIFILDTRKSQNTAIVLKSLGISRQEIIDALIEGHGLNSDTIEKLSRIAPTNEEASEILAFDGDPTRLADAESFLYHLLKAVPSAFARFSAMLFRLNYDTEVSQIKGSLQSLESACKELRTRGLFLKLLEAVLKAGNRLNAGTSRGNAQAFNLTALRKLSDVKSSDGKTTLLQFVVQEVVRAEGKRCVLNRNRSLSRTSSQSSNSGSQSLDQFASKDDKEREYMMLGLPVIGGLSAEFTNVKKAATLDFDLLVKTSSALAAQVVETRTIVVKCRPDGGFAGEMNGFLDTAELEVKVLKEEQTRVMEIVKKTTDYYQAGSSKDKGANPFQLFVIVRDFLGMVDQVCIDIARNVQKRKPVSSVAGSSSPGSPRVFRFPKLPANFMSESSMSSSNDSDNDSEV
ncbi:formin-like protein 4 [Sesamum indicum]|uniref:Formin-like protein n=1 Tax=Sesamum indicum TaxID=4182 RepID=A0A6I9TY99_SESIN|nr:formin-like protein 4 [Sesamum indicum]